MNAPKLKEGSGVASASVEGINNLDNAQYRGSRLLFFCLRFTAYFPKLLPFKLAVTLCSFFVEVYLSSEESGKPSKLHFKVEIFVG